MSVGEFGKKAINSAVNELKGKAKKYMMRAAIPVVAGVAAGMGLIVAIGVGISGEELEMNGSYLSYTYISENQDYDVYTESSTSAPVITDIETLKKAFEGYSSNSKLIAEAQTFLDMQEEYKVNAIFAAAVSIQETSGGTNGSYAIDGHNWFNYMQITSIDQLDGYLGTMDSWCKWDSDKNGIMGFGYYISQHSSCYFSQGEYTVSEIGSHYCDPPDDWISSVKGYMTKLYTAAGITEVLNFNGNGDFLEIAKQCHDYFWKNNFYYKQGNAIPYPNDTKHVDCSAFVSWALYEYGYTELFSNNWQLKSWQFRDLAKAGTYGWTVIPIDDIQPGDLVWRNNECSHIEIYAGEEKVLSCGSDESIRCEYYTGHGSKDKYIAHVKKGNGVGIRITKP